MMVAQFWLEVCFPGLVDIGLIKFFGANGYATGSMIATQLFEVHAQKLQSFRCGGVWFVLRNQDLQTVL